jgi:predicted nucleotidyltransferase
MKTSHEYLQLLKNFKRTRAAHYGITSIGIFGSVARGNQSENSDVDVFYTSSTMSLLDAVGLWQELEDLLGNHVDAVSVHDGLNPSFKKQIETEGIYA